MTTQTRPAANISPATTDRPNGAGAAAVLAAGVGSFSLAIFAILGDKSSAFHSFFNFSRPTGPLSGVTTSAIVCWLVCWAVLHALWGKRNVALALINLFAFALLLLSLLMTFPPIADLF